jgi:hypothetical protein
VDPVGLSLPQQFSKELTLSTLVSSSPSLSNFGLVVSKIKRLMATFLSPSLVVEDAMVVTMMLLSLGQWDTPMLSLFLTLPKT